MRQVNFQLIQPSLVPGVVEVAPPLFLDQDGNVMADQVEQNWGDAAPPTGEGELIQGTAMDLEEGDKSKAKDDE